MFDGEITQNGLWNIVARCHQAIRGLWRECKCRYAGACQTDANLGKPRDGPYGDARAGSPSANPTRCAARPGRVDPSHQRISCRMANQSASLLRINRMQETVRHSITRSYRATSGSQRADSTAMVDDCALWSIQMAANAKARPELHDARFPGESSGCREARNQLLEAEIELRRRIEEVAALRRKLPLGGAVPVDYEFTGKERRTSTTCSRQGT
jgi:hypothetical protein